MGRRTYRAKGFVVCDLKPDGTNNEPYLWSFRVNAETAIEAFDAAMGAGSFAGSHVKFGTFPAVLVVERGVKPTTD